MYDEKWPGEGGVVGGDEAVQVRNSKGFSKGGIPGMNFRVSYMRWLITRVYIVYQWTDI